MQSHRWQKIAVLPVVRVRGIVEARPIRRNPMRHPSRFAHRLRGILLRKRLGPADLARRLGRGHADAVAVSNWLSGRNAPSLRNLLRLSDALKTDPAELLTDDPRSTPR